MTIFEKIIAREIPADIVHEDDLCIAFRDVSPQAPTHILIIPKKVIPRIGETTGDDQSLLGHLLLTAGNIATDLGVNSTDSGFRLVINNGKNGGESVPHLHIHLLADRPLEWPPG
ncbi:MAG: histidine triad nucleotide-binding protein [Verrucomicrobiales bacterium]|nr:histidine triad nucleotide-binding protein [Verrucomicrobiales bacterium]